MEVLVKGKVEMQVDMLAKNEATKDPVGLARKAPNKVISFVRFVRFLRFVRIFRFVRFLPFLRFVGFLRFLRFVRF